MGSTEKVTVPLPFPLLPEVTAIQDTSLTALHAQPDPPVTLTLPLPPLELKFALFDDREYEQPDA